MRKFTGNTNIKSNHPFLYYFSINIHISIIIDWILNIFFFEFEKKQWKKTNIVNRIDSISFYSVSYVKFFDSSRYIIDMMMMMMMIEWNNIICYYYFFLGIENQKIKMNETMKLINNVNVNVRQSILPISYYFFPIIFQRIFKPPPPQSN